MARAGGPSLKKIFGIYIGASVLVGVCVVGVLYGVALGIAGWRQSLAETHWAEAGLPVEGYLKTLPHHPADDRARRLDEAAKALDLSLLRYHTESKAPNAKELEARREQVRAYLRGQLESPSGWAAPPSEALGRILEDSGKPLQKVRSILLEGPPSWQMEPSKGNGAEIPSLLDQLALSELLVADALAAGAARQDRRAREDLEAAWSLADGLTENPILLVRLIELALRKEIVSAVRKVPVVSSTWTGRLAACHPEEGMLESLRLEAAIVDDWAGSSDPLHVLNGGVPRRNPVVWVGTPYFRFTASRMMDYQLDIRRALESLNPCASDEEILAAGRVDEDTIPAWDKVSKIALTQYGQAWGRVRYCRIQLNLTRNVLALKDERDKLGRWPDSFAPTAQPDCPSERWDYSVTPGGEMTLRFIGPEPTEAVLKATAIHSAQTYIERPLNPMP